MPVKSFTYNNAEIFYEIDGNGKTIVLLHGFAETSFVWKAQFDYLKKSCKVIVPDLPGYGKSSALDISPKETSIEDYSECICTLIKNENIDTCTIIGHSMGGYIILPVVEKHPEMIDGFGFVNSTAFADSEEKKQMRLKGIETIKKYGAYSFVKNTTPNLFVSDFRQTNADEINELIELSKDYSKTSLQQSYYAMMNRPDKTSVLKNNNYPVLFIIGEQDKAVPVSDILKQVSHPETSYIHILNNVNHMAMWEAAGAVNVYLEEFVNEYK